MEPYYQDDWATIYHGDCREILPALPRVDLVLTDPPYGIGEAAGKNASRGNIAPPGVYTHYDWDNERCPEQVSQAVNHGTNAIVFGGNYYTDILPPSASWIVWDKRNGDNDFADCELAWTSHPSAVRMFRWRWQGMLQERGGRDKEARRHPTQKPVALMRWWIERYSEPMNTILDPFMGSGTTLRAGKDLNRHGIGIDLQEEYCEIAANRLQQEVFDFTGEGA